MPFKWRLKKTKRYEISTKNAFIVGVYLLDNSFLECTLTAESTGKECLESIGQRIELTETHYFGLRYVTKKLHFHWVDLERPLKKQLDKQAQSSCHPPCLYFGVQFYVASAHRIVDEVARFHYYLQLKNDIIDGRLPCSVDQAVRLASLSLQAEFGDSDFDKQNPGYFKDHPLLPKSMTKDENTYLELLTEVINGHYRLHGVHGIKAEIQYIKEVQQMDGFGTEYYVAKDESNRELYLGTSYIGLFARFLDRTPPVFFRWNEIARISQNKKNIEVDTSKSSAQYTLEDTDTSKYLCRIINQQIKFYKSSKANLNSSMTDVSVDINETDNNNITESQVIIPTNEYSELTESQTSLAYIQDQRYTPDVQVPSSDDYYSNSQQSLDVLPDVQQTPSSGSESVINDGIYMNHQPVPQQQPEISDSARQALLPAYKHAPDYETLMAQRGIQQVSSTESSQGVGNPPRYNQEGVPYNSEPEIPVNNYDSESQYANAQAIRNYNNSGYTSGFQDGHNNINNKTGTNHLPVHSTYSSPELNTQGLQEQYPPDMLQESLAFQYRPPPPYPRTSSSTPDLAAQAIPTHNSEIPDVVAQQGDHFGNLVQQSRLDKSVENLNTMDTSVNSENISSSIDQDDTSSEHSYATFHVKDDSSDDEVEKLHREESERKKIQIRLLGPKDAPPPSKTKEVATLRESFRRMMIARAGPIMSSKPGDSHVKPLTKENLNEAKLSKVHEQDSPTVPNPIIFVNPVPSLPIPDVIQPTDMSDKRISSHLSDSASHVSDSASDNMECLDTSQIIHTHALSMESSLSQQEDSDSDLSDFADGTIKRRSIGPLKRAAMNGLTLSRPMVLALMNDESRAPKDERRKILESKISEGQVFKEFEEIYKRAPNLDYNVAKLPENNPRNRFKDVLPYDNTRVKLTPRKDNPAGYINASHVKLTAENMDWSFIATQAPLENTVSDFWQMIWEQEVDVVAMLTALTEQGRQKCFPYKPDEPGSEHKQIHGDYDIELLLTDDSLCYVTRRIRVKHIPSGKSRQIWHLQYTDWPDHGCPDDIYGFLGFLDEIESVRRLAESEEGSGKKSPVVIHCSAGVGRTGVVILTAVMKWCLEHNHSVDLPKALMGIRQQRMYMVQTVGQYQFIHNTLIQYLKNTRLI